MGTLNLGRVRGTMWYSGTAITGTSTTGTIFSGSGISAAYTGDMYLNTSTGSDAGNVYTCTVAGNASTAKWAYTGALKVQADIINNLNSTETNKALAANQGRVLKELIEGSGILPLSVLPKVSSKAYTANITVKNANGTITVITADGEEGTYTVTASGSASTITAIFTIGSDIGLSATGAVIQEIRSTQPIYEYHLFNNSSAEIAGGIPDLWTRLNEAEENVRTGSNITDGSETVKGGILSKIVDGVRSVLWPITHAKAVWFDKANNKTVHDVIGTETMGTSATTLTGAIAEHESDISALNSNTPLSGGSSGSWYAKFPTGLLIQWGSIGSYSNTGGRTMTVDFPQAFVGEYHAMATARYKTAGQGDTYQSFCTIMNTSSTQMDVFQKNPLYNYINSISWVAFGFWK